MTARQRLVKSATIRLAAHNARVELQRRGKSYSMSDGTPILYCEIRPQTLKMNELLEGTARRYDDTWQYYLDLSDFGYRRLENECYRNS